MYLSRTINTNFLNFREKKKRGERKSLMRVSLSKNLPFFLFSLGFLFLVDLRVVLEQIFI